MAGGGRILREAMPGKRPADGFRNPWFGSDDLKWQIRAGKVAAKPVRHSCARRPGKLKDGHELKNARNNLIVLLC